MFLPLLPVIRSVRARWPSPGYVSDDDANSSRAWSSDASDSLPDSIRAISWARASPHTSATVVVTADCPPSEAPLVDDELRVRP